MDFKDQLKKHFPDHKLTDKNYEINEVSSLQIDPIICKYEKRKGKASLCFFKKNQSSSTFSIFY